MDEITAGGLPKGRPTLVCGNPGCGKTLLAMEFIVRGATEFGEPGVFMAFEETAEDLAKNVVSLGFDLDRLVADKLLVVDYVHVERNEIEDTGEFDLEGLFVRLDHAINSIGAKRVVLDTIEALFGGISNHTILRAELRRLFRWLKDRGVTAVITGERGEKELTRQGLEEYVSDCVILLDHRVSDQIGTRRLRIVKYRGSIHGTNEYPFLIDEDGISVLPVTSAGLSHAVSEERISSGIPDLDAMLGGGGFYRGSSILLSGAAGTGKSTICAHFADAACRRGERVAYFAFEEAPKQILRNMRSLGLDLQPWIDQGLLRFHAARPTSTGLELHLTMMHKIISEHNPGLVILDPMSSFLDREEDAAVRAMLLRLVDHLKSLGITGVFTSLASNTSSPERTDEAVSSLMDAWLLLRNLESDGERNRGLYVLKARGMAHSNQIREFIMTSQGIQLKEPYIGPGGVFTGSARLAQEARDAAASEDRRQRLSAQERDIERKRKALEAKIAALQAAFEADAQEAGLALRAQQNTEMRAELAQADLAASRRKEGPPPETVYAGGS